MEIEETESGLALYKERVCIGRCAFARTPAGAQITSLCIAPEWRRRGYGSYLLRALLHRTGGFVRGAESLHTAPLPADAGEQAFWRRFGFAPAGGCLVRRRVPDLSAVQLAQDLIRLYCPAPRFAVDATCGNGRDTEFLCRLAGPAGRVLAMDVQPQACAATRARLEAAGLAQRCTIVCDSHAQLARYAAPGSADLVLFNFGWLPGAPHEVFSTAETSLPALAAALEALRPGGLLSAVLYSGRTIGDSEKQRVLAWLAGLPLEKYTVLACTFANWADTAPLPCLVRRRPAADEPAPAGS